MEIKNKVAVENVLKTLVLKEVSVKALAKQREIITYIDNQITQYGAEKHLAFLTRVFHNQKVSATQFFKTLSNVKANTEKKAQSNKTESKKKVQSNKTESKKKVQSNKTESKKNETKVQSNKTESKKNKKQASGERSSLEDYERLESDIVKLVEAFNAQWSNDIEVEVVVSYEYRVKKTTTIR